MPWLRSIRLDVYSADDKNRIYDAEVQKRNTGGLAKRSRFYQALIDSTLLPPGEGMNFHPLPESFLIMITLSTCGGAADTGIRLRCAVRRSRICI